MWLESLFGSSAQAPLRNCTAREKVSGGWTSPQSSANGPTCWLATSSLTDENRILPFNRITADHQGRLCNKGGKMRLFLFFWPFCAALVTCPSWRISVCLDNAQVKQLFQQFQLSSLPSATRVSVCTSTETWLVDWGVFDEFQT